MNKFRIFLFLFIFFSSVLLPASSSAFQTGKIKKTGKAQSDYKEKKAHVPTEQEKGSLMVFTELLDLIESTSDRKSILSKIEKLYNKIIRGYPEAPLAQESYWKLITLYIEEYSPPSYEKAEALYNEFISKYPGSVFKGYMVETIGRSYYRNAGWDKLLEICGTVFRVDVEQCKKTRASVLFMFTEANNYLGKMSYAEKGYKIGDEKFRKLNQGVKSKSML